jgi:hypothetical protein
MSQKYGDVSLSLCIMLRKKSHPHTIPPMKVGRGIQAIVIEVVMPQSEMRCFMITVGVSSTMLCPSC